MNQKFGRRQSANVRTTVRLLLACFSFLAISCDVTGQRQSADSLGIARQDSLAATSDSTAVASLCHCDDLSFVCADSLANSFTLNHVDALKGIVILLDAGHGGSQDGALYDSVAEKNVNLAVTFKLKARLEAMGATVHMTRVSDITLSLQGRVDKSIKLKPDIFVSVHANANRHTSIDGIETYYYNRRSMQLAETLLHSISRGLKEKPNWVQKEGLFVLHHNVVPSTLVEIGYLSNTRTNALLKTQGYQERVAESIAKGIYDYFQIAGAPRGYVKAKVSTQRPKFSQRSKSSQRAKTSQRAGTSQKASKHK